METKIGKLGLNIPIPTQKAGHFIELTPEAVTRWRNRLPMADTGSSASQVYHLLSDCNQVVLPPQERYKILELLRTPVQYICQSLRKHYLQQTESLNEKKLTIVKLAQTLQLEMAKGYKLILEDASEGRTEDFKTLGPLCIERILHYFTHVLLRSYHLYSLAPADLYLELYTLYILAEQYHWNEGDLLNAFKHPLIMAATDPYRFRQSEQDAIFNASLVWAQDASIRAGSSHDKPGIFFFELKQDLPPSPPTSGQSIVASNARLLDLTAITEKLKAIRTEIEPDELRARMQHSNDPNFAIPLSVLNAIIESWDNLPIRTENRVGSPGEVRTCISLSAIHYYASGEKSFIGQTGTLGTASTLGALPTLSIQEESTNGNKSPINIEITPPLETKKPGSYPLYKTFEVNETLEGYCLVWMGEPYPPLQAGELLGIEKSIGGANPQWMTAMVRWLKHPAANELRIGVRLLSQTTLPAAIQILKEEKPAGYFLRCLILENGLLTPTIPFKTGSHALITKSDGSVEEVELLKLRSATSSYKLFDYRSKELTKTGSESLEFKKEEPTKPVSIQGGDDFDSLWTSL